MIKMKDILDEKDKRLRLISKEVTFPLSKEDQKNIELMEEYLVNSQIEEKAQKYDLRPGMGMAAIQIGVPKRMCIVKDNINYIIMINPYITKQRGAVLYEEGCLSAPKVTKKVMRAQKVWCTYTTLDGKQKELDQGGLTSIIVQHELDHFDGWCEVFDNVKIKEE